MLSAGYRMPDRGFSPNMGTYSLRSVAITAGSSARTTLRLGYSVAWRARLSLRNSVGRHCGVDVLFGECPIDHVHDTPVAADGERRPESHHVGPESRRRRPPPRPCPTLPGSGNSSGQAVGQGCLCAWRPCPATARGEYGGSCPRRPHRDPGRPGPRSWSAPRNLCRSRQRAWDTPSERHAKCLVNGTMTMGHVFRR